MTSSPASSPVTLEISASRGWLKVTLSATRAKSSSIGSMAGEWKACDTRQAARPMPSRGEARQRSGRPRRTGPEITTCSGPLIGGDAHEAGRIEMLATLGSAARTAAMAPPGSSCMSRPRAATSASPSSRLKHAGHAGRRQLADAVAHDDGGLDAPRLATARRAPTRGRRAPAACSRSRRWASRCPGRDRAPRATGGPGAAGGSRRSARARVGSRLRSRTASGPCRRTASPGR